MSTYRYKQITNNKLNQTQLTVSDSRLSLDYFGMMMLWAKEIDEEKGENLYFRTRTEYYYRKDKNMAIPGNGTIWEQIAEFDIFCYFDTTEIQNAIDFITNDIIPSLNTYLQQFGEDYSIEEKWGGEDKYGDYYDNNKGYIKLSPSHEYLYYPTTYVITHFNEFKAILQDSLDTGNPYTIYTH